MQCPSCQIELPSNAAFCSSCGLNIEPEPEKTAAPAPAQDAMTGGTVLIRRDGATGDAQLEPGSTFAERYEIEKVLGSGGMGVVYKALDTVSRQPVALKLINTKLLDGPDAVDRLVDEGVLTRKIQHRNVVNVYDVGKFGEQPYLSMEHLEGESLRSWLGKQLTGDKEVSVKAAIEIIKSILEGLGEAHRNGIVHRDLKPENVFLLGDPDSGDFQLKILDFGIAKSVTTSAFTSSASALGTLPYMAPEQKTTPDAAGPAADIYSLSRMFYELLMDVLPEGPWQAPSKHRPDVPVGIDALLEKGLSNRPRSRQQSVGEFEAELTGALAIKEEPVQPPVEPPPPPPPNPIIAFLEKHFKKDGRWDTKKIASVAAAVVIALILIEMIPPEPDPPPDTTSTVQVGGTWFVVSSNAPGFQTCNRWQINQNGQTITGRSGIWTFKGRFNGAVLQGTNRNTTNGAEFPVFSRLVDKGGRYDFVHGTTTMHVNHQPGGIAC